jgi:hypothetical protein
LDPVLLGTNSDVISGLGFLDLAVRGLACLGSASGLGTDGCVDLLVEILEGRFSEGLFPSGELLGELLGVLSLEGLVVSLNVSSEDVFSVFLGVKGLLGLFDLSGLTSLVGNELSLGDVGSGESLVLVGDVETTIDGSLHGTEDSVSSGGSDETNIEESLE